MSSSESLPRRLPGWLILMGALTAIGPFSTDMYLPAFPAMAEGLHTTLGEIERTLAIGCVDMSFVCSRFCRPTDRSVRIVLIFGSRHL